MKKDIKKTIAAKKCESNFIHLSITASKAIALPYQLKSKAITLLYLKITYSRWLTHIYNNKENLTSLSLLQCLVSISISLFAKRPATIAIFISALL